MYVVRIGLNFYHFCALIDYKLCCIAVNIASATSEK